MRPGSAYNVAARPESAQEHRVSTLSQWGNSTKMHRRPMSSRPTSSTYRLDPALRKPTLDEEEDYSDDDTQVAEWLNNGSMDDSQLGHFFGVRLNVRVEPYHIANSLAIVIILGQTSTLSTRWRTTAAPPGFPPTLSTGKPFETSGGLRCEPGTLMPNYSEGAPKSRGPVPLIAAFDPTKGGRLLRAPSLYQPHRPEAANSPPEAANSPPAAETSPPEAANSPT
eukprot:1039158-Pyramimonas_sp.AAC.2